MKAQIEIRQGDISEMRVDAVVNAANTGLLLGSGVAGAIRRRGGPSIQQECNRIGPIPLGEAVITGGGDLFAHYVIHAASMGEGHRTSEETLRQAVRNSFLRATERGVQNIAFPAIGTGVGGFPIRRCAEILLDEAVECLHREGQPLERVVFVLYREEDREVFHKVFQERHPRLAKGFSP